MYSYAICEVDWDCNSWWTLWMLVYWVSPCDLLLPDPNRNVTTQNLSDISHCGVNFFQSICCQVWYRSAHSPCCVELLIFQPKEKLRTAILTIWNIIERQVPSDNLFPFYSFSTRMFSPNWSITITTSFSIVRVSTMWGNPGSFLRLSMISSSVLNRSTFLNYI